MADETLLYRVSWEFTHGGEQAFYRVYMKASQAKLLAGVLEKHLDSGYLTAFEVYSVAPDTLSPRDIMQVIKEQFPRTGKEWMP